MGDASLAERRRNEIIDRAFRVVGSLSYGVSVWVLLQLAIGGLECTPTFSFGTAITRLVLATLAGFPIFVVTVSIIAAAGYVGVSRSVLMGRPKLTAMLVIVTLVAAVALPLRFTPPAFGQHGGRYCDLS